MSSEFKRDAARQSIESRQSRLGYSTLGAQWRDLCDGGATLHVEWQCCLAAAEAVADWMLSNCEDDLKLSFASANVDQAVLQHETLELWQYVLGEDWRLSKRLQADFGHQEGSRLWFGTERAVARTIQWIKDDVLSSLRSLHGSPQAEPPWSFKPFGKLADMAGPRFHHFLFLPWELCTRTLPTISLQRGMRHIRYSAYYSLCSTYLAALECPDRGEQTRKDVVQVFEQLDLSAVWGETDVEYWSSEKDLHGNVVMRSAPVSMLSITYLEHYAAAASKKNISKKNTTGYRRSQRKGLPCWVVKQR